MVGKKDVRRRDSDNIWSDMAHRLHVMIVPRLNFGSEHEESRVSIPPFSLHAMESQREVAMSLACNFIEA